jgi:phage gp36-like protein
MYLVHLEFISGEHSQTFFVCIPANSFTDAEKRLDKYLMDYYPDKPQKVEDVYHYYHGEIAVKWLETEELPASPEEAYARICSILSIY